MSPERKSDIHLNKQDFLKGNSVEVAKRAEYRAKTFLNRHSDLIFQETANLIAQKEYDSALNNYLTRRENGLANDEESEKPGIIIYVSPIEAKNILDYVEKEYGPVKKDQVKVYSEKLSSLRFPKGVFYMVDGGLGGGMCQFYREQTTEDTMVSGRMKYPFAAKQENIVRIEGKAGELWQNPDYRWDGTPKGK
jgi:hypothetical protein